MVYLLNLNYFIQIGGDEILIEFLKNTKTIHHILLGVDILNHIGQSLEDAYFKKNIQPQIFNIMHSFPSIIDPEDIKTAKKDDIIQMIKSLKVIISSFNFLT